MTEETFEIFYFTEDEFENTENLRDVIRPLGEENKEAESLQQEFDAHLESSSMTYNEVRQEEVYSLEDGKEASLFETDEGLFIFSQSSYLSNNSRSIPSRSKRKHHGP